MTIVKISKKYEMTIPKAVRDRLKLRVGSKITIQVLDADNAILIQSSKVKKFA